MHARTAAAWIAAGLFAWLAVSFASIAHSPTAAALALLASALCLPPLRRRAPWLSTTATAALCLVLFAGQAHFAGRDAARASQRASDAETTRLAQRAQLAATDRQTRFESNKVAVLREISATLEAGRTRDAWAEAEKYPATDPDLANLKRTIEAAMLKQETAAPMLPDRGAVVFARLAELEPSSAGHREKAQQYAAENATLQTALDRLNRGHCPGADYDYPATLKAFMRGQQADPALARRIDSEGPFVGMSEPLFLAWFCPTIDIVKETETAAGSTRQYVMKRAGGYVYTKGGIVTAVQR